MEITNFIERDKVEQLREKIYEFMDVLEYEISIYSNEKSFDCLHFLNNIDQELHKKLIEFNNHARVSK